MSGKTSTGTTYTDTVSAAGKYWYRVVDLHATILHLMGIDHTKLTYFFQGRDYRLTDVHGKLLNEILA